MIQRVHNAIKAQPIWFSGLLLLVLAYRLLHFGEVIDGPHTWRQCDTAQYILALSQDFNLLYPKVCWLGSHQVLILEFPLPEALAAIPSALFGHAHTWARIVFFLFYLGGVYYLFKSLQLVFGANLARIATILYASLPLGLFYSRAVHIDFSAIFFVHGMLYYWLNAIQQQHIRSLLFGTAFAIFAFLIKAPYAFFLALPLAYWTHRHHAWKFMVKWSPVLITPLLAMAWWVWHTKTVNAQAPDWDFIPGYHKFTDMWHWYFGVWEQRLDGANWSKLFERLLYEAGGIVVFALMPVGVLLGRHVKHQSFALLWLLGAVLYLLIFFNLNVVHNYYQIPFLAPFAVLAAMTILRIKTGLQRTSPQRSKIAIAVLTIACVASSLYCAEREYFVVKTDQIQIGQAIRDNTPEDALVVVSYGGMHGPCPNLLYRARRNGWTVAQDFVTPQLMYEYHKVGARYLALVRHAEPEGELGHFTAVFENKSVTPVDSSGLKVFLYEMAPKYFTPSAEE